MNIITIFEDKKVLLWGYGIEGKSFEKFLFKYCTPKEVKVYEGDREGLMYDDYDIVVKTEDHWNYRYQG